ncbi:MAG: 50S ribosomal protein L18 [candidate division Zixibacteria bacterium]|nr:50S ribosomal protein L18 [candidate division Zixibacteria bacterium]
MADKNLAKNKKAERRRRRVRAKIKGSAAIPRLTVSKSAQNTFAQLIDDQKCATIASAATNASAVKSKLKKDLSKVDAAKIVGEEIAKIARKKGIEKIVFDRNKYIYHGRIKAVAEGARSGGLKF